MPSRKRELHEDRKISKHKRQKLQAPSQITGSHEEVLYADISSILRRQKAEGEGDSQAPEALPAVFSEVEVKITSISSIGDGLGHVRGSLRIYIVPFSVPGDVVLAKVVRHSKDPPHTVTDFIRVLTPGPNRNDDLVRCRYFARCGGCQLQMLPYEAQLAHKRTIVEKAYRNFSGLPISAIPEVEQTAGSPLQYGYRTKLTPHFDGPPGGRQAIRKGERPSFESVPPMGFLLKGTRRTLDIEECPIGTSVVQKGLVRERERVVRELDKYRKGATILLRESTKRIDKNAVESQVAAEDASRRSEEVIEYEDQGEFVHAKTCVSDNRGTSIEYVDDFVFHNSANAFFQNNNSVLPSFTSYIRERILAPGTASSSTPQPPITNLIDAYSGSGLFAITLSSLFTRTIGIDISEESIESATQNLRLNKLDTGDRDIKFLAADASKLFATVPQDFQAINTAVVIDPPRKGCDKAFLTQLLAFGPARIVYVSCNVHTQARDVGWILRGGGAVADREGSKGDQFGSKDGGSHLYNFGEPANLKEADPSAYTYEVESLRGFDFFPQTGHVEGVAVLRRKVPGETAPESSNAEVSRAEKGTAAVENAVS